MNKTSFNRRLWVTIVLFCLHAAPVSADWSVYKRAQIKLDANHILKFETNDGKTVRATFKLRHQQPGIFGNNRLRYKIDNGPVRDVSRENGNDVRIRQGESVRWVISKGESPSEMLKELMKGGEAVFQYYRSDGKVFEAVFNIDGADKAISSIIK